MVRAFLLALAAAAIAIAVFAFTSWLGLGVHNGLIGVVGGVVLGLVPQGSPLARYGAFVVGLVFGLIAIVLGFIGPPGFFIGVVILTIISTLTLGKLELWAMLLGAGVFAGMYINSLVADAWYILTEYPTAFFAALATSSGGFLAAIFAELFRADVHRMRGLRRKGESPVEEAEEGVNA